MSATATTEKPTAKASDNGTQSTSGQTRDKTWNLHQRIVAITDEVKVQATGTTGKQAGDRRTISIGDVDEALGPVMAKYGVVSDYEFAEAPTAYDQPTRDGTMKMWLVNITGYIYNADDPKDLLSRKLFDIGSNPSAAVSFALKRWKRALFKLVEDDDQDNGRSVQAGGSTNGHGAAPTAGTSLTPDQALEVTALNASLPKPYNDTVLAAMAKSGFQAASNALRTAHKNQCSPNGCEHIAKA